MTPRVAVVIPTFNRREFLRAALESVLSQTHPVAQVLVCDDGSSDGTREMVIGWNDERVRFLPGTPSGGPAAPRNRGIAALEGADWVAFVDDDDAWREDKIEVQLRAAQQSGCLAVCSNALVVDILGQERKCAWLDEAPSRLTIETLAWENKVVCPSALVHASLLPLCEGFCEIYDLRAIADFTLWLRVAAFTDWHFVPENLVTYRDDRQTSIRAGDERDFNEVAALVGRDFAAWVARHHDDERVRVALKRWRSARLGAVRRQQLLKARRIAGAIKRRVLRHL